MAGKNPKFPIEAEDKTGKAFSSVQKNLQNVASSAAVLEGPLGKVAGRINALGAAFGRMNPLAIAGGVALSAVGVAVAKGTSEFADYEQQMFRINKMLEITEGISGQTADGIDRISLSLGRNTLASQQGVRSAAGALLRFTNITNENFEKTLKIGQDITELFGGDLQSNVILVGRAMDNPARGLETLERKLISVDKEWKNYVVNAHEAGDLAESQSAIMGELTRTLEGTGEAGAGGLKGAIDSTGEAWTDLIKMLSAAGPVEAAFKNLTSFLDGARSDYKRLYDPSLVDELSIHINRLALKEKALSVSRNSFFGIASKNLEKEIADEKGAIKAVKGRIELGEALKREEADRVKAKQVLAELNKKNLAAERQRTAQLKLDETAQLKIDNDGIKRREKLAAQSEAIWRASLPPLEKLKAEYDKDAANHELAFTKKAISATVFAERMTVRAKKFGRDVDSLGGKDDKKTSRADQIREQLLQGDDQIEASRARRAKIVLRAIDSLDATEVAKRKELLSTLGLLQIEADDAMAKERIDNALAVTNSITDIVDTAADYFTDRSRRMTEATNDEFSNRADKIREDVRLGVITTDQGNKKLEALEGTRQAHLDKTARKQFERGKKLARAAAVANAAAAVVGAYSDTPGPWYVRLAAGAAAAVAGAAQVSAINATQFDGGGSVNAPISAAPLPAPTAGGGQQQVNQSVVLVGNENSTYTLSQMVDFIKRINEVSGKLDLQVIDPASRNARDIRDASSSLVI